MTGKLQQPTISRLANKEQAKDTAKNRTIKRQSAAPSRFNPAIISALCECDYEPFDAKSETVKCATHLLRRLLLAKHLFQLLDVNLDRFTCGRNSYSTCVEIIKSTVS